MIVDRIDRSASYNGIVPEFKEAMEFALSLADKPVGTYQYDKLPEGTVFAMVQEGETRSFEDGMIEAHRKYMDVQIMLEGGETVYYADIDGLTETVPYKEDSRPESRKACFISRFRMTDIFRAVILTIRENSARLF